jgi:hypothetical protein
MDEAGYGLSRREKSMSLHRRGDAGLEGHDLSLCEPLNNIHLLKITQTRSIHPVKKGTRFAPDALVFDEELKGAKLRGSREIEDFSLIG